MQSPAHGAGEAREIEALIEIGELLAAQVKARPLGNLAAVKPEAAVPAVRDGVDEHHMAEGRAHIEGGDRTRRREARARAQAVPVAQQKPQWRRLDLVGRRGPGQLAEEGVCVLKKPCDHGGVRPGDCIGQRGNHVP